MSGCDRRRFLGYAGATALRRPPARPNILFIFTDQQTLRAMSAAGNPHLRTPAMDRIAAAGALFERSYCASPVCGPSRASLLTSRMPHEHGVQYNGETPSASIPEMGGVFRAAGYRTVWGGKWHLPESYPLRAKSPRREIPGFELLKFYDSTVNYPEWGFGDTTDGPLAGAAVDFLRGYSGAAPFLLALSFCNPHDVCYCPRQPQRYPGPEDGQVLPPLPPNFAIDPREPEMVAWRRRLTYYGEEVTYTRDWDERRWQWYLYHYYRMTERVDREIGRVLDALERSRRADSTLILFTSDHGDGAAAHRWAAKLTLYEEPASVPMLVSWKGRTPAGLVDASHPVSGLDVLPTLCDYAGLRPPPGARGRSLRAILDNPQAPWREYVVTELAQDPKNRAHQGRMLRTARYKYNLYSAGERNEQLFDLAADPGETQNLAFEPAMQSIKARHREMLAGWIRETRDDFSAP